METQLAKKHGLNAQLYTGSRFFERGAYYGLRAIMILYLIDESMGLSRTEALTLYGYFTSLIFISQLLGGILGDLLIGSKRAILIGGSLQTLGAFCMAYPDINSFYAGMGLVLIGGGLYSPNLMAQFGKLYIPKKKLLYAGFSGLYTAMYLGAFLGILAIGIIAEKSSWSTGFILAGILMLIAVFLTTVSSQEEDDKALASEVPKEKGLGKIFSVFLVFGLFWFFYEFNSARMVELQKLLSSAFPVSSGPAFWGNLQTGTIVLLGIVAVILGTLFYYEKFALIAVGFLLGAAAFGGLLLFPQNPTETYFFPYLMVLLALASADMLISPTFYATLTQYANPKYLGILMGLTTLPTQMANTYASIWIDISYDTPQLALGIAAGTMVLTALVLFLWVNVDKNTSFGIEKIEEDM